MIALVTYHQFPVQGEKTFGFDNMVRDHAELCELIQERAVKQRAEVDFGGEAVRAEMAAAHVGVSFLVHHFGWVAGEVFRISVLGKRLLFYRVGAGAGMAKSDRRLGLEAWGHAQLRQKFQEEMRRVERADASMLLQLAAVNEGSFAASLDEFTEVRLDPPSLAKGFLRSFHGTTQEGYLKLVHARRGAMTLAVLSREDVRMLTQELPKLFGPAAQVNVVWSHSACAYVGRS